MDQKEHKEEQFQAVIDGTENIKPKKKKEEKKGLKYELLDLLKPLPSVLYASFC